MRHQVNRSVAESGNKPDSSRGTGTLQERVARLFVFKAHLLARYNAKSLKQLPVGPRQDFETAARRAGLTLLAHDQTTDVGVTAGDRVNIERIAEAATS